MQVRGYGEASRPDLSDSTSSMHQDQQSPTKGIDMLLKKALRLLTVPLVNEGQRTDQQSTPSATSTVVPWPSADARNAFGVAPESQSAKGQGLRGLMNAPELEAFFAD